jgi:hypothetical protein
VVECRVNGPIPDTDLDMNFPEGSRVEEVGKRLIHLWGSDRPAKTFAKDTDFINYIEESEKQRQAKFPEAVVSSPRIRPILWIINAVLIAFLAILVILRTKLGKRT